MSPIRIGTARRILPILGLSLLAMTACDSSTEPAGDATIRVQLTDAPSDMLDSARVWISKVYLQGGAEGDDEPGRVYLFEAQDGDEARSFDLLRLRDGVVADLAEATVEPRAYAQLRLVVDSSRIWLAEGFEMEDGATTASLRIPSGSSSGIKVQLERPLDAESEATELIVVDFDVDEAFTFQNVGPTGVVRQVRFSPVLREWGRGTEGSDR